MQTFLPYADFKLTAEVLDWRRLGKQRVEAKQIILALEGKSWWSNHPAVKMWRGYKSALARYGVEICNEWVNRGYKDSLTEFFTSRVDEFGLPPWLGNEQFHASHRSNLLRKAPQHYQKFNWSEPPDLPYVWPSLHLPSTVIK